MRPPPEVFPLGGKSDERNFWFAGPSFRCRRDCSFVLLSAGCAWWPEPRCSAGRFKDRVAPCHSRRQRRNLQHRRLRRQRPRLTSTPTPKPATPTPTPPTPTPKPSSSTTPAATPTPSNIGNEIIINSPSNSQSISGKAVSVSVTLGPDVYWDQLMVDGTDVLSGNGNLTWNSTTVANGTHTLKVRVFQQGGTMPIGTAFDLSRSVQQPAIATPDSCVTPTAVPQPHGWRFVDAHANRLPLRLPAATPTPGSAPTHFSTLGYRATLPSESQCTAWVNALPIAEHAPANTAFNVPPPGGVPSSFYSNPAPSSGGGIPASDYANVTGNYAGTTDADCSMGGLQMGNRRGRGAGARQDGVRMGPGRAGRQADVSVDHALTVPSRPCGTPSIIEPDGSTGVVSELLLYVMESVADQGLLRDHDLADDHAEHAIRRRLSLRGSAVVYERRLGYLLRQRESTAQHLCDRYSGFGRLVAAIPACCGAASDSTTQAAGTTRARRATSRLLRIRWPRTIGRAECSSTVIRRQA